MVSFATAATASAECLPLAPMVVLERFVSAQCPLCWQTQPPTPKSAVGTATTLALDWIVAMPSGTSTILSAAALPEASARAARGGKLADDEALTVAHALPQRSALHVRVADGVAWNGYIGVSLLVQYDAKPVPPAGLVAYVALVERAAAGEDGSPVARQLVRSLAGPFTLAGLTSQQPFEHRLATRLPDGSRPERLVSVGWVETAKGRVIAVAAGTEKDCPTRP